MAAISITVNNGLFSIGLDQYEWTGLTVNGQAIPPVQNPDPAKWIYNQYAPGIVEFTATSNQLVATNDGQSFVLAGNNSADYVCTIWYTNNPFVLHGVLIPAVNMLDGQPGPFAFNQGNMTGTFSMA